jgi:Plasma-membrane choline transporter
MPSPYQQSGSQISRFPFGSRAPPPSAPLFYSATDEFREENDGEEHEREVADYYALQRSRRHFGASRLSESSEVDDDDQYEQEHPSKTEDDESELPYRPGRGIRSSWKGDKMGKRGRKPAVEESVQEQPDREHSRTGSEADKAKGKLVDVELSSSEQSSIDGIEREELEEADDDPPAFQQFPNRIGIGKPQYGHNWIPEETDDETARLQPRPPSPDRESVPPGVTGEVEELPRYDIFWGTLFWIALASLFASAFLVWLHTDTPTKKNPLGDTIYSTLTKSYHLLAVDTLVAVIVATLWLALLRSFLRPLTYLILVAVPIIMFSFSLYPLISSFKGSWKGSSLQDKMMRTFSFLPLIGAILWTYLSFKARHSIDKAVEILGFGMKVLAVSPALVLAGFVALMTNVVWFWVWLAMFSRVFLEGHWSTYAQKNLFVIDVSSWWLGAFYVLMLLWTQSVISGIQRATSAATVSQWYFHRNTNPAISSRSVVSASFAHASGTLFGTICLSTFLSIAIRLPLLFLPRTISRYISFCFYSIVPSPIASLTNPLTLTYAAIHSQNLSDSARSLSQMSFVSRNSATTTLGPNSFDAPASDSLIAYRTAKLLLHSTRYVMALALGFGGWVATARLLQVDESYRGSLYAYVVGLGAAAIGWAILGAMEGVILGIVDAVVVCWGSEVSATGRGQARYCREAGDLFEDKGRVMV